MEIQYSSNVLDLYTLYWIHCHISLNVIFRAIWLKSPAQPTSDELLKSTRNPGVSPHRTGTLVRGQLGQKVRQLRSVREDCPRLGQPIASLLIAFEVGKRHREPDPRLSETRIGRDDLLVVRQ